MNEVIQKLLTDDNLSQSQEVIRKVAEVVGASGEFIFEAYRRQVYVSGIGYGVATLVTLIIGMAAAIWARRVWEDKNSYYRSEILGALVPLCILALLIGLGLAYETGARFINPNYYLIHNLWEIWQP